MVTLLSLPRLRTVWLGDEDHTVASLYTVTFVWRIVLLCLESVLKWKHVEGDPEAIPAEERQGLFGRTFFWWLMPLFFKGYQRDITMDDLFAIDQDLKGEILWKRLQKNWDAGKPYPLLLFVANLFSRPHPETPTYYGHVSDFLPRVKPRPNTTSCQHGV